VRSTSLSNTPPSSRTSPTSPATTAPHAGSRPNTFQQLFGEAAWAAHDPATVLAHHARYRRVSGWFECGDQEHGRLKAAHLLSSAVRKDGIHTKLVTISGAHVWQTVATSFAQALPWLSQQLGLQGTRLP
jgi:S-formylglutathione hydrolase FrmB